MSDCVTRSALVPPLRKLAASFAVGTCARTATAVDVDAEIPQYRVQVVGVKHQLIAVITTVEITILVASEFDAFLRTPPADRCAQPAS